MARLVSVPLLALLACTAGSDTSADTPAVGGVVTSDGTPVDGARVTLVAAGFFAEARTGPDGTYAFADVPDGTYALGASARDLEYVEQESTVAGGDGGADLDLGAETEPGRWDVLGTTAPETYGGTNSGVLMANGKVIYCHDTQDPVVFDPVSLQKTLPRQPDAIANSDASEQGCHNITTLADGRVLYVGGGTIDDQGNFSGGEKAVAWVKAFDPWTETWERFPDLNEPRWYPGLVRLPDGDLLAFGGGQQNTTYDKLRTDTCERFDRVSHAWTPTGDLTKVGGFGPAVTLFDGRVLMTWDPVQTYDPSGGTWTTVANFVQPDRGDPESDPATAEPAIGDHPDHSIVLLPDGRVAAIGIWATAMESPGSMTEIYDPDADAWSLGASPEVVRAHPEVLQLPDGRIFVGAGIYQDGPRPGGDDINAWDYVDTVDLYDPVLDAYRSVAPMPEPHEYHTITLLLPDGRVLIAAGEGQPGLNMDVPANISAFTPPYLLRGPRPAVDGVAPFDLVRGGTVSMTVTNTAAVTGVVLIGTNAITHFLDAGTSRMLDLDFTQTGDTVTAEVPSDPNVAMAGWYILFAMVDDIPSNGTIVKVVAP